MRFIFGLVILLLSLKICLFPRLAAINAGGNILVIANHSRTSHGCHSFLHIFITAMYLLSRLVFFVLTTMLAMVILFVDMKEKRIPFATFALATTVPRNQSMSQNDVEEGVDANAELGVSGGGGQKSPSLFTVSRVLLNSLLYKSGKELEELQKSTIVKDCMELESLIADRDHEVRWMLTLGRRFRLGLSTIGLGIAILDRILRLVKVPGKYLHCLAVSAMGLAVKFHEEIDADSEAFEASREAAILFGIPSPDPLNADDLAVKELNRMERTLLSRLQWDLLLPSFDRFLQAMLAVIGAPHLAASSVLRRNFELVLSQGHLVWHYSSSVMALSLLSIMLEMTSTEWPRITESLKIIFQIDNIDLAKCRNETAELLRNFYMRGPACKGPNIRRVRPQPPLGMAGRKSTAKKQRHRQASTNGQAKHRRAIFGALATGSDGEQENSPPQQKV